MIKIMHVNSYATSGTMSSGMLLYADTKSEVPETGSATRIAITDFGGVIPVGSILYTADLELAVLTSDNEWNWVGETDEEES